MFTKRTVQHVLRRSGKNLMLGLLVALLLAAGVAPATTSAAGQNTRQHYFQQAAQEFGVPESLLLALSYNEARWSAPAGQMSMEGGYGNMNLRTHLHGKLDGRGKGQSKPSNKPTEYYTLDVAASLTHQSTVTLKKSDEANIRGGAAVLAKYARDQHGGKLPGAVNDWYGAVAKYSGAIDAQTAQMFADSVFSTLQKGASTTTTDGQALKLTATTDAQPQHNQLNTLGFKFMPKHADNQGAECPSTLDCRFIPAAYTQNSSDPADYGSFDYAHRPKDMDIKYIVIHDTEGSYDSAIAHFQDPTAYVSGNYIIRSSDGAVTQMVHNKDVSWGAGDWYVNMHAINIEHEGFAAQGATWYTEAMYQSSATLVRWLAARYHIPLDREHIIGHDNVPTTSPAFLAGQHWDPGPYWDWNHYMDLLHNGKQYGAHQHRHGQLKPGQSVTISPDFAQNQPPVQDCSTGTCTDLPTQGSNFVYLRTSPDASAPLLSDPYLHPDNAPGTINISDWSAKATSGQQFVVAQVQGDWVGIYYAGKLGWFHNPTSNPVAERAWSAKIKPRAGHSSVPVYGVAYPEASAYPSTIPVQNLTPLYTMPAGQAYTTNGRVPTDYFYDATIDYSKPDDHAVVRGHEQFYQIWFNHRIAYVKASDVSFSH